MLEFLWKTLLPRSVLTGGTPVNHCLYAHVSRNIVSPVPAIAAISQIGI